MSLLVAKLRPGQRETNIGRTVLDYLRRVDDRADFDRTVEVNHLNYWKDFSRKVDSCKRTWLNDNVTGKEKTDSLTLYLGYPFVDQFHVSIEVETFLYKQSRKPFEQKLRVTSLYTETFFIQINYFTLQEIRLKYASMTRHGGNLIWERSGQSKETDQKTITYHQYNELEGILLKDNPDPIEGISQECSNLWRGVIYLIDENIINRENFVSQKLKPYLHERGYTK